eukprot:CAMPEP_0194268196 /NCGR_PEP_ID=MMETSP0169-20130528/2565_1 /TAXON_ID=218684 /ORGANISM="Corethron pennatum, Strain L29A3" /LENGTH=239 /DNA_ID=CAMNT_0039009335 /DNA_START=74 /DNA_END=790 /DNA_ORIENTATION=-
MHFSTSKNCFTVSFLILASKSNFSCNALINPSNPRLRFASFSPRTCGRQIANTQVVVNNPTALKDSSNDDNDPGGKLKKGFSAILTRNVPENSREERQNDELGPLLPLATFVDEVTGGWALSYADLAPENETTPAGLAFLITNLGYGIAGLVLSMRGEILLGSLTELAGIVSFGYHYTQLKFGANRKEVRLALLFDYITACSSIFAATVYIVQAGTISTIPVTFFIVAALSIISLVLSW